MVSGLTEDGVHEVNATESSSDEREDSLASEVDLSISTDMREDVLVSKFAESQFSIVCVSAKVFHTMKGLPETAESLAQVLLVALVVSMSIHATIMNSSLEAVSDVTRRRSPVTTLVGNVVLHSGVRVNCKLRWLNGSTETLVKLSGVDVVGIVFRVVYVLLEIRLVELCGSLICLQFTSGL
jgi:hypothetical protein